MIRPTTGVPGTTTNGFICADLFVFNVIAIKFEVTETKKYFSSSHELLIVIDPKALDT